MCRIQVRPRKWFSFLVNFRGLTATGSDEEVESVRVERLQDPSRESQHSGLDETWTTNLKLALMATELQGKQRLTAEKLGAAAQEASLAQSCLCPVCKLALGMPAVTGRSHGARFQDDPQERQGGWGQPA